MNANERRWALVVGALCVAGVILATLGRVVFVVCARWPVVGPWLERIGAVLLGVALLFAGLVYCRYLVVTARGRRIARGRRGPVRTSCGGWSKWRGCD